jgi:translation initiation factor eIF-2B subunit delta
VSDGASPTGALQVPNPGGRGTPDVSPKRVQEASSLREAPVEKETVQRRQSLDASDPSASLTPRRAPVEEPQSSKPSPRLENVITDAVDQQTVPQTRQEKPEESQQRPAKKEMTKSERRALQEAQRAAKLAAKSGDAVGGNSGKLPKHGSSSSLAAKGTQSVGQEVQAASKQTDRGRHHKQELGEKQNKSSLTLPQAKASKPTELFFHLPQYRPIEMLSAQAATGSVPTEVVRVGYLMAQGKLRGTNARCSAMLDAFAGAIQSFKTSTDKPFAVEFGQSLNSMVKFLVSCRPLSPAMGNVITALKAEIELLKTNPRMSDSETRSALLCFVSTYSHDKIQFATEALSRHASEKISAGDVVITYARSSSVEGVLLAAAAAGTQFSVVVLDARPLLEGRQLLQRLIEARIPCEYCLLNGMQGALARATKVLLGAAAVRSNGTVVSRVGTAAVAMAASHAHVPVIVCAETYKFHKDVQLDSITHNELGDPEALAKGHGIGPAASDLRHEWAINDNLSMLNLMYDATPAEFVTVVSTELGILPPTSVPVVLREYRSAESLRNV